MLKMLILFSACNEALEIDYVLATNGRLITLPRVNKNPLDKKVFEMDMIQILGFPELLFLRIGTLESSNQKTELDGMFIF